LKNYYVNITNFISIIQIIKNLISLLVTENYLHNIYFNTTNLVSHRANSKSRYS